MADDAKIVFVVGAGASREFGLPTGAELLREIAAAVPPLKSSGSALQGRVYDAFRSIKIDGDRPEQSDLLRKAEFIRKNMSLAPSIDNFLHTHADDELLISVEKILIAAVIGEAEKNSTLCQERSKDGRVSLNFGKKGRISFSGKGEDVPPAGESWLAKLFWLLVSGRTFGDFKQALSRISFVCFNYDRCIEQFISVASESYFELDAEGVREVLSLIEIIHPYGELDELNFKRGQLGSRPINRLEAVGSA